MKKIFKSFVIVLVGVLTLTACGKIESKTKDPIVGKWVYESMDSIYYVFKDDGTGTYTFGGGTKKFTYKIDGDKISILYDGDTTSFDTTFSIDGNKLNVKDSFGSDTIYKKK